MKNKPTYNLELSLKNQGYKYIIGVDEAGRGPLMGPVVAAAVHIPDGFDYSEINDSKKLSSKKREILYNTIIKECKYSYHSVGNQLIDRMNILEATKSAMMYAIRSMESVDYALIDGNFVPYGVNTAMKPVVNGDNLSVSIAAASIVAKVTRDKMIEQYHKKFPIYNWIKNKGYGTQEHRDAIKLYGPTIYHRKSFGGVKEHV